MAESQSALLALIPGTSSSAVQPSQDKKARVEQMSLRIKHLPIEMLLAIIDYLGPATCRLLAATCTTFRDIYQAHYKTEGGIVVFGSETYPLGATQAYLQIMFNWVDYSGYISHGDRMQKTPWR
ncbi:uncharacterized protein LY89DRAFT_739862 [Mollisia scopiformis]|uniref:F-box domain-containing protein n=1 Tax=Mollisia scopiformis TaxID=149040 RepID=A0A194WSE2_MOLSC|nr:uncharacterized protein LY89DRAFT_739862 [Mollisia scopiformis]KUJ10881.1 hypothetical protein LY89DRAFT_739862 [Mollisia scopiformis]